MGEPQIIAGDCRAVMASLPERHFHCVVTSPPYFGLRDYGVPGQVGLEPTPDEYVRAMLDVFGGRDNPVGVWRVLRDDGTLWLNIGDSYAAQRGGSAMPKETLSKSTRGRPTQKSASTHRNASAIGLKHKDMIGIPWRTAFALRDAGWYLRDAVVWNKPSPMPGSQKDRCTTSYEFIFLLAKREQYYFDLYPIRKDMEGMPRNVWTLSHEGYSGAHFATFPKKLPMRCIKASTSDMGCCPECGKQQVRIVERFRTATRPAINNVRDETGMANRDESRHITEYRHVGWKCDCECGATTTTPARVLDPFSGAGTTGVAASLLGREYTGIELNQSYAEDSRRRIERELKPSTARITDERTNQGSTLFG